jgi:hypothetical protein
VARAVELVPSAKSLSRRESILESFSDARFGELDVVVKTLTIFVDRDEVR